MLRALYPKVLIIENQMIIAADIFGQLVKLGYEVIGINDSLEAAMPTIRQTPPDMVLMNVGVRGKTDRIAAARTLMHTYQIPVIFLSADLDRDTYQQLIELQPFAFISKPFNSTDLQQGIVSTWQRMAAEAV